MDKLLVNTNYLKGPEPLIFDSGSTEKFPTTPLLQGSMETFSCSIHIIKNLHESAAGGGVDCNVRSTEAAFYALQNFTAMHIHNANLLTSMKLHKYCLTLAISIE